MKGTPPPGRRRKIDPRVYLWKRWWGIAFLTGITVVHTMIDLTFALEWSALPLQITVSVFVLLSLFSASYVFAGNIDDR